MNENPVVQVVLVGILLIVVGFLLMTRVFSSGEEAAPTDTPAATTADPAATPGGTSPEAAQAVADAEATDAVADAAAVPGDDAAAAEAGVAAPPPTVGEFAAGPGLPEPVVEAHESGDTVVVLVTRSTGTDDKQMKAIVGGFRGHEGIAVFTITAKNVADYARITEGVNLDRTPALVVVSPKSASKGPLPEASVSYAYRSHEGVEQAIRDAGYKGPRLPYHPE